MIATLLLVGSSKSAEDGAKTDQRRLELIPCVVTPAHSELYTQLIHIMIIMILESSDLNVPTGLMVLTIELIDIEGSRRLLQKCK